MGSKFSILEPKYPQLFKICEISERLYLIDHNSTISKSRLFIERMTELIYKFEKLDLGEETQLYRIKELYNGNYLPKGVKDLFHTIRKLGNRAVHKGDLSSNQAFIVLNASYKISIWFLETYEKIFVEDIKYELPTESNDKSVETLETEIEKTPVYSENIDQKADEINRFPAIIQERRHRSKNAAKRLELNLTLLAGALGFLPGALGIFAFGSTPVGWITGAISGVGYIAYKYNKVKKGR